jgi:O-antigen/teichoic acid export membrane protein
VAAASLVNIAIFSVPVVFVGKLCGMKELGQAQMAFSLYSNLLFVTAAVVRLNLNTYARLVKHAAEFIDTVNKNLRILAAVLVPIVAGFAGFSPLWTAFVFGQKWQGLSLLLLAQAPGYFMAAVFWGVLNPALLVSGKHRQVLCWLMAFAAFYSLLTRILTPAYGALGVAIAFSTAEVILNPVLFGMYGAERLEYQNVTFEIMIGLIFVGCLWISSQNNARAACICGAVYLGVWWTRNYRTIRSATQSFDLVGWCRTY